MLPSFRLFKRSIELPHSKLALFKIIFRPMVDGKISQVRFG